MAAGRVATARLMSVPALSMASNSVRAWPSADSAARMESNGIPSEIQVSEAVHDRLNDRFRFSEVHIVNLKGKGPTPARLLLGPNGSG